jgi:hypothetical protein
VLFEDVGEGHVGKFLDRAIRSCPNCVSLAKVSSSKAINFRTASLRLLPESTVNRVHPKLFRQPEHA